MDLIYNLEKQLGLENRTPNNKQEATYYIKTMMGMVKDHKQQLQKENQQNIIKEIQPLVDKD